MNTENQIKFNELIDQIKELYPDTTTSVKIVITADNTRITTNYRYPEQLKKGNISMRNIKGDFIKQIRSSQL